MEARVTTPRRAGCGRFRLHHFFSSLRKWPPGKAISSGPIIDLGDYKFCIDVYPGGTSPKTSKHVAVYLNILEENGKDRKHDNVFAKLSLMSEKGATEVYSIEFQLHHDAAVGFPQYPPCY